MRMLKKFLFVSVTLFCYTHFYALAQNTAWHIQPVSIKTKWADDVSPSNVLPEYPRPQLIRKGYWKNLNGLWDYAITNSEVTTVDKYLGKILVPFPLESALSGVKRSLQPNERLWYRKVIEQPSMYPGERLLLHFGAVDWESEVFINGKNIGIHKGGYTSFSFDITDHLTAQLLDIVVKVSDPTDAGIGPNGKQVLYPGDIYYTPSSGIWQTVWLEKVPARYVSNLRITPQLDNKAVDVDVIGKGDIVGCSYEAIASIKGKEIGKTTGKVGLSGRITLKEIHPWSPNDPFLYDLTIKILNKNKVADIVKSYFGLRKLKIQKDNKGIDRIFLNNNYQYNLGTLDQGFWPDGLYTAPTDDALKFDIQITKALGFNTIRKHIKVEPARWYYYADKLGILVWQDMVNPNQGLPIGSKDEFEKETNDIIEQLYSHPAITTWVLFNEKWGQFDQERLTKWMKEKDPSRIVNGHSGEFLYVNNQLRSPSPNAYINADITDVHSYPNPKISIKQNGKAQVCGEFGGIGVPIEGHIWDDLVQGWGYDGVVRPEKMKMKYSEMVDSLVRLEKEGLSGSIYTQITDVESEQNGLLTYDRKILKLPIYDMRSINNKLLKDLEIQDKSHLIIQIAGNNYMSYQKRLEEYLMGKKDSAFLRSLTILAGEQKDTSIVMSTSKDYLQIVKDTFSIINIRFLLKYTYNVHSPAFNLLINNLDRIGLKGDADKIDHKLQEIVYSSEVLPKLNATNNWVDISRILSKYPQLEGERIMGMTVIYYFNMALNNKSGAIKNAVRQAEIYDNKYHRGMYNNWAWTVFQKSDDKMELKKALEWSKKELNGIKEDHPEFPLHLDTYANLLYKTGRIDEALENERRAKQLMPNNEEIAENYEKMKKGKPTW